MKSGRVELVDERTRSIMPGCESVLLSIRGAKLNSRVSSPVTINDDAECAGMQVYLSVYHCRRRSLTTFGALQVILGEAF